MGRYRTVWLQLDLGKGRPSARLIDGGGNCSVSAVEDECFAFSTDMGCIESPSGRTAITVVERGPVCCWQGLVSADGFGDALIGSGVLPLAFVLSRIGLALRPRL